ncbi:MAG: GNAT family N-acetyltransferase [Alphaproteobacteria bacterium]
MSGYRLRRATPADAAALSALKIACWRDAYAGQLPADLLAGLETHPRHSVDAWRAVLEYDGPVAVTEFIDAGDRAIGFLRYGPYGGPLAGWRGRLDALYLLAPSRGHGVGTVLAGHAQERLAAAGHGPVTVAVFVFNTRALALYRRLGAEPIGRAVAFEHNGRPINEVVLGWRETAEGV